MLVPSTIESVSSGTKNRARARVKERLCDPRSTPIVTGVPSAPRTLFATSSVCRLVTSAPSTVTMRSPSLIPARSAGVPGMTLSTTIGSVVEGLLIVTPMPETGGCGWLKPLARVGSR